MSYVVRNGAIRSYLRNCYESRRLWLVRNGDLAARYGIYLGHCPVKSRDYNNNHHQWRGYSLSSSFIGYWCASDFRHHMPVSMRLEPGGGPIEIQIRRLPRWLKLCRWIYWFAGREVENGLKWVTMKRKVNEW